MIHNPLYVGVSDPLICTGCGILLPPNYGCPDCRWEVMETAHQMVEICSEHCSSHVEKMFS